MAEKTPRLRHSFFSFWGSAIKIGWTESREKFGLVVDITLALSVIGILIFAWYSKQHPKFDADKENAIMSYWLAIVPVGLWLIWLGWHIFRAPYDIYKEKCDKAEIEIEQFKTNISTLSGEIQSLNLKLAEKSEADKITIAKQNSKDFLGGKLMSLDARLGEARSLSRYEFVDEEKKKQWEITEKLFNDTERVIIVNLTLAELGLFRVAHGDPVKEITDDPYLGQRFMDWRWHYNSILAKRDALQEIIKRLV